MDFLCFSLLVNKRTAKVKLICIKSRQTPPTAVFHLLRSSKVPIFLILPGEFSYQADVLSLFVPTFKIMGWFDEK